MKGIAGTSVLPVKRPSALWCRSRSYCPYLVGILNELRSFWGSTDSHMVTDWALIFNWRNRDNEFCEVGKEKKLHPWRKNNLKTCYQLCSILFWQQATFRNSTFHLMVKFTIKIRALQAVFDFVFVAGNKRFSTSAKRPLNNLAMRY